MEEIYSNKEVKEKLLSGINKLADTVLLTMGPEGKTVIITGEDGMPYTTKDGVSVAKSISFKDPVENAAAILLKQVAQRTVEQAGDGTTTSICLAQAFINKGYELMNQGISYNDIKEALTNLETETLKYLKKASKKLNKRDIINVATISANNDVEIGKLIKKAYDHSKIVKVEESDNLEDSLETVTGMEVDGYHFNKAFINDFKKQAIKYDKCKFIIVEGKLENLEGVKKYLQGQQEYPIVIMADHFTDEIVSIFKRNFNNGALQIGLVKSPSYAQHRKDLIEDIISYTDAINNGGNIHVSEIDGIFADKEKVVITKLDPNTEKITKLKEAIKEENNKQSKKLLQNRIDNLEGSLSIIKVGGRSELEVKERKDRIDDAVQAVKSAMEEGIVSGGGITLLNIVNDIKGKSNIFNEVLVCLAEPYNKIKPEMYLDKSIVDPHKVTRCAFQNAISVAKTFLSTEAVVLNEYLWN